jgi:hypothetical protein
VKLDVKRVSGGYRVSFIVSPRSAKIHATFDGSDPKLGPVIGSPDIEAPGGATRLRAIAEIDGQFGEEESAPLQGGTDTPPTRPALKLDAPATLTSRFEPKDTAEAFSALDRLAKAAGTRILGGSVEVNGGRSEQDFLTLRLGRDVPILAGDLDGFVKTLVEKLSADAPTVKLRLDGIEFSSGRELTAFSDDLSVDFDRVTWDQKP